MESRNIYFVVSHPIQYFVPLYKHIARQEDVHLKVLYLSEQTLKGSEDKQFGVKFIWDLPLLEGYAYTFLKNISWRRKRPSGFWGYINPGLIWSLWQLPKGLVVISGWNSFTEILGYFFGRLFGHTVSIRCDAPLFKEENRFGLRAGMRRFFIGKVLFKYGLDRFLYLGSENYAFYKFYQIPDNKLTYTPFSVDNDRFRSAISTLNREAERKELDISPEDFVVLFTGKLIDIKRPFDLLKAFSHLNIINKKLVLVGDGMLRKKMEDSVTQEGIENVHFVGFVNQLVLPKYYLISDVLVLSSETETWGLSINEGMACHLPVVISDTVGCGKDLVIAGQNGYIYPKGDIPALTASLHAVYKDFLQGGKMGIVSSEIIDNFSVAKTADGILAAAIEVK